MLERRLPLPVKLVCAFLYRDPRTYQLTTCLLKKKFGEIDLESQESVFEYTDYYDKEMGTPLYRRFISFARLRDASQFVGIKLYCIALEKKFSHSGARTVNIDPGYLNEAKFVLTTTKDFFHRIYLGKGIFAELTMYYKDNAYQDLPTTYPDYRSPEYKQILGQMRQLYRLQIQKIRK